MKRNLHFHPLTKQKIFWYSKAASLILIFLLSASFAQAATKTWTGATSTAWAIATNWTGGVPGSGDDVVIGNFTPGNQPTLNANTTILSLTINGRSGTGGTRGSMLTINTGVTLTITNNFTINGSTGGGTGVALGITASGTASISVGGNVLTVNSTGGPPEEPSISFGSGTLNVTGSFTLGTTTTFTAGTGTVNFNGLGAQTISNYPYYNLTISGSGTKIINGVTVAGNFIISGSATATPTAAVAVTGNTILSGTSVLTLGAANILSGTPVILDGGTFRTGSGVGFNETVGTLGLTNSSTLALGTGNHTLTFANSSGVAWSGTTLTITGWSGTAGSSGTAGKIFVGANNTGLTAAQLAKISFSGYTAGAQILSNGEIVPIQVASPPTITNLSTLTGCQGATGIIITGTNFTGATAVNFNGVSASYTVNSATQITATVPLTATSGTISVTTSGGTATSPSSFTVNPSPTVSITGSSSICIGGTTLLSPVTGGTWASSNAGIATVTNAGVVTGVAAGSATFTFTLASTGCTNTTSAVTVNALPAVSITGSSSICVGSTTTLSPTTGGTWASSNAAIASVTNGGIVTGVSAGSATFTYTNTITGCVNTTGSVSVTTIPATPGNPTSNSPQCIGFGVTLTRTGTPPGGETWYWQTSAGGTSTANSGNTYNVAASGTYYIRSQNNTSLCWSTGAGSATVAVNPPPTIIVSSGSRCGPGTVILGATPSAGTINWYDSGGNWLASGNTYTTPSLSSNATYFVDATSGGCTSTPRTAIFAAIINPPTISVGGAGTYCTGSTISLTSVGNNLTNQYWTGPDAVGPNHFYSTDQNPIISGATSVNAGTYTVTGSALSGINLIFNGDFELGKTGFGTSYTYRDSTYVFQPGNHGALWGEGDYCMVANPNSTHANFSACPDHTPSGHLQMVVNGAATSKNIWSQTVNVVENTDYQFTYWVQSVNPDSPSQSQLYVNTKAIADPYEAIATPCNWKQFVYNWTSGPGVTVANLVLQNQNTATGGNDFALDDIVFQQACATTGTGVVTVNAVPTAGAIGNAPANIPSICVGSTPAALTSTSAGTGTGTISYEWQTNASGSYVNIPGATAATYAPPALAATTSYQRRTVAVSDGVTCYSPYTSSVTITVTGPTVTSGGPDAICQSASPSPFALSGSNSGGAPTSAWSIISGGGALSSIAQTATPQNVTYTPAANFSGTVILRLTTAGGSCTAIADRTINVRPTPTATISGTTAVCRNATSPNITFTNPQAFPVTITYNINGTVQPTLNVGASTTAIIAAPTTTAGTFNYNLVSVIYQSAPTCSNSISGTATVTVNANSPVSVSVAAVPSGAICLGTSVTFTASPTNGGTTPAYQWKVNGGNVGTNSNTYTYTPVATDVITCVLTSNLATCVSGNPATSSPYTVSFSSGIFAGTLTPSPAAGSVCMGTSVSATATPGLGGGGTITDILQSRFDGGAWVAYTSGTSLSTSGHTSVDIQTYRTATSGCPISSPVMVSWTINPVPVSGTLTSSLSVGAVCSGATISATATAGSGGAGTITDVLQYRFDGGGWVSYTSGLSLSTFGHTSVEIQTYRTATGSGCTSSTPVVLSWTINAQPVSGTLTPSPAVGSYCEGTPISAVGTIGSGGAGTITDVMQYRFDGGTWTSYTTGSVLNTNGHTTLDIQTFRTATGSGCTSSTPVVASWILRPLPATSEITTE